MTIRQWARRYAARQYDPRQLGVTGERAKYYDYADLATIDACIHRGEQVPATPEARDLLRERYKSAA